MKSIKKIKFTAKLFTEGSWGTRSIAGKHPCTMELFGGTVSTDGHRKYYQIEFVAGKDGCVGVEHIGLTVNENNELVDYDGVFSIPLEGIKLIESVGIIVSDDFR